MVGTRINGVMRLVKRKKERRTSRKDASATRYGVHGGKSEQVLRKESRKERNELLDERMEDWVR